MLQITAFLHQTIPHIVDSGQYIVSAVSSHATSLAYTDYDNVPAIGVDSILSKLDETGTRVAQTAGAGYTTLGLIKQHRENKGEASADDHKAAAHNVLFGSIVTVAGTLVHATAYYTAGIGSGIFGGL